MRLISLKHLHGSAEPQTRMDPHRLARQDGFGDAVEDWDDSPGKEHWEAENGLTTWRAALADAYWKGVVSGKLERIRRAGGELCEAFEKLADLDLGEWPSYDEKRVARPKTETS